MFWINRPNVTVTDIVEILIIAFLLYHILVWFKTTRAWTLFKGILVILVFILGIALFADLIVPYSKCLYFVGSNFPDEYDTLDCG